MENIADIDFGLRIRELIESKGINITDGAKLLNYSRQNFTDILNKKDVSTAVLKKVCIQFETGMEYFIRSNNTNISQVGNANQIGAGNKVSYRAGDEKESRRSDMLENENQHLKEQNKLLKEMIELLKPKPL